MASLAPLSNQQSSLASMHACQVGKSIFKQRWWAEKCTITQLYSTVTHSFTPIHKTWWLIIRWPWRQRGNTHTWNFAESRWIVSQAGTSGHCSIYPFFWTLQNIHLAVFEPFLAYARGYCPTGKQIYPRATVLLQTESNSPPGFDDIIFHHSPPSRVAIGVLVASFTSLLLVSCWLCNNSQL